MPQIIQHPLSVTTTTGRSVDLSVSADGSNPLTFNWYRGHTGNTNAPLQSGPSSMLRLAAVRGTEEYWVRSPGSVALPIAKARQ